MGFLDKVKEQAAVASAVAKDAAVKGQAKLEDVQAKRAADVILRDLGVAVYAQQTDRASATTPADIDRLVGALKRHESEHGALTLSFESAAAGSETAGPTDPPAGP